MSLISSGSGAGNFLIVKREGGGRSSVRCELYLPTGSCVASPTRTVMTSDTMLLLLLAVLNDGLSNWRAKASNRTESFTEKEALDLDRCKNSTKGLESVRPRTQDASVSEQSAKAFVDSGLRSRFWPTISGHNLAPRPQSLLGMTA